MQGRSVRLVYRQILTEHLRRLGVSVSRTKPGPGSTAAPGLLRSKHTLLRLSYRKSAAQFRLEGEENSVETRESVSLCSERQLKWDPMVTLKCLKSSYPLEEKYKINQVRYGWVWGENPRLNRGQGNCGNWKAMSKEEKAIQWIIVLPDSGSGLSSPENGSERG